MATDYGFDTACVSDVGLVDVVLTSPQLVIGQRVARRLQTRRSGLAAIDPAAADFGFDVRQFTLGRIAATSTAQIQNQVSAECTKDEEVASADVTVTAINGGNMTIIIQLMSAAGPFTLTLNVTALTVEAVFG
jgi:ribonuclease PH